jgi:hypothetical protein
MTGKVDRMALDQGPGEAAESANRKRWFRLLGTSMALGAISGGLIAYTIFRDGGADAAALPVWIAALLSAGWLVLMGYGAWYYETQVDELERNANYYGYAIGGGLLLLLYPVWYAFWWAGELPEPSHEVLMAALLVAALAGYLWKKYR